MLIFSYLLLILATFLIIIMISFKFFMRNSPCFTILIKMTFCNIYFKIDRKRKNYLYILKEDIIKRIQVIKGKD
jgi:hypothetical protein